MNIYEAETGRYDCPNGGQTPLNLAERLMEAGVPILGLHLSIAAAEDRELFRQLLDKLSLKQPESATAKTLMKPSRLRIKLASLYDSPLLRIRRPQ